MVTQTIAFWVDAFWPLMLATVAIGFVTGARHHRLRARRHVYDPTEDAND